MKIKLAYAGRRLRGDKIVQAFIDLATDDLFCFAKVKYCTIGYLYEAAKCKSALSISVQPRSFGVSGAPEKTVNAWVSSDAVAAAEYQEILLAKRCERNPPQFQKAIKALEPLVESLSYRMAMRLGEMLASRAKDEIERKAKK